MAASAKTTLVDDAYSQLKERIRSNEMPPGFQIPEPELALNLGMSRTPVREALIRLDAEGLIELIPRRGVRVLPVKAEDMQEIYDILQALEPFAAMKLAMRKPGPEALAALEAAVAEMEAAIEAEDLERWAEADDAFHVGLLDALGNKRLSDFITRLYDQAHRARMLTLRLRELPRTSTIEQRNILESLKKGDPEEVQRLFNEHRERVGVELLDILGRLQITNL